VESEFEDRFVAAIDRVLSRHSGGGLIATSELVDTLLDLRTTVTELALLASLDQQSSSTRLVHTPTTWPWHKEPGTKPSQHR